MQLMTERPPATAYRYLLCLQGNLQTCNQAPLTHEGCEYLGRLMSPVFSSTHRSSQPHIGLGEEDGAKIFGVPDSYPCTSVKGMRFQCMNCSNT